VTEREMWYSVRVTVWEKGLKMVCREFRVEFARKAYKWLRGHREAWSIVDEAVKELRVNPFIGEELHGRCRGLRKYRRNRLRIVYSIDTENCTVIVWRVGYRENIYEEIC